MRRHSMAFLRCRALNALALFLLVLPLSAQAPATKPELEKAIQTLFAGKNVEQAAISPDGKQVAWVESVKAGSSAIYVAPVSGGQPRRISASAGAGSYSEHSIAWSPDSKRIAFLSDAAKPGQAQLYVVSAAGGPVTKLT